MGHLRLISASTPVSRLWAAAAAGAVALHIGCFAAVFASSGAADDDALGAPAIEIGVEPLAPRLEESDLPPGPEAESASASQAVEEQKAVIEKTDLPKAVATETDDPDRLVSAEPVEKQTDKEPEKAALKATASIESTASEATAPPSSTTIEESKRSVAPVQGIGEAAQRVRVTWQKQLLLHLDRHKRYPAIATHRSAEITVSFVLDRSGHVMTASVAKGSGDPAFDDAALAMMKRADPVPPPPPPVADEGLTFTLPVIFRVRKSS